MDGVRRIVYTIDPYGTRSGFPTRIGQVQQGVGGRYGTIWNMHMADPNFSCPIAVIH